MIKKKYNLLIKFLKLSSNKNIKNKFAELNLGTSWPILK